MGKEKYLILDFGNVIAGNIPVGNQPVGAVEGWNCTCGASGISSKFCPECGAKRPEKVNEDSWDWVWGVTGLKSKVCQECGAKKGEGNE